MRVQEKRLWLCFVIMLLAQSALADPPPDWQPDFDAPHHPENLLVRFTAGASEQARQQAHSAFQATEVKRFRHLSGLTLVKVPSAGLQAACTAYLNNPNVLYAEPDYEVFFTDTPDDPLFNELWGLHNTGQIVRGAEGKPDADIDAPVSPAFGSKTCYGCSGSRTIMAASRRCRSICRASSP